MAKPKGATSAGRKRRVQMAVDLIVKRRLPDADIVKILCLEADNKISNKTAERAVKEAKEQIAGLGQQPSSEERGRLCASIANLIAGELSEKNPDRKQLNQFIRTELAIHKTHPELCSKGKGQIKDEHPTEHTQGNSLSPELADALAKLPAHGTTQESSNTSENS